MVDMGVPSPSGASREHRIGVTTGILRHLSELTTEAGEGVGGEECYADALARLETDLSVFNEQLAALGGGVVELRYPDKPSLRCIFGVWDMAEALKGVGAA